jgi:hypothetical protein
MLHNKAAACRDLNFTVLLFPPAAASQKQKQHHRDPCPQPSFHLLTVFLQGCPGIIN